MTILVTCLTVFLLNIVVDWIWTKYIQSVSEKHAHRAAMWSVLIVLLGAINVIAYTNNRFLLIPAVAGGYLGAYFAVRFSK